MMGVIEILLVLLDYKTVKSGIGLHNTMQKLCHAGQTPVKFQFAAFPNIPRSDKS